jgi:hypothetical protein
MGNPFCHIELHSSAVAEVKSFYGDLFDWSMQDMPMGEHQYTMVKTADGEDEVGGGITQKMCDDAPNHWLSYVLVDDVDASLKKATDLGGSVIVDKTEIPEMGHFGVLADPSGAALGVYQATKKA